MGRRLDEVTYVGRQFATRHHVDPYLSTDSAAFQPPTQLQLGAVQGEPAAVLLHGLDPESRQSPHVAVGRRRRHQLGNPRRGGGGGGMADGVGDV